MSQHLLRYVHETHKRNGKPDEQTLSELFLVFLHVCCTCDAF